MRALKQTALVTDRHNVFVSTWQDGGEWWARFTVDTNVGAPMSLGPVEARDLVDADR